jgi:hypothetical protein
MTGKSAEIFLSEGAFGMRDFRIMGGFPYAWCNHTCTGTNLMVYVFRKIFLYSIDPFSLWIKAGSIRLMTIKTYRFK